MDCLSPKAMELRTAAQMAHQDEMRLEAQKLASLDWDEPKVEAPQAPSLLQTLVGVFTRRRKTA